MSGCSPDFCSMRDGWSPVINHLVLNAAAFGSLAAVGKRSGPQPCSLLSQAQAAVGTRAVKMQNAGEERERLEMGRLEAVWEMQEESGNKKSGMCWSAAASERTVAKNWILPKFKG